MNAQKPKELLYCPLGGAGEIGMNLYLYGYGTPGEHEWIIVDCGITFGDDSMPGVDVVMADPAFIEEHAPYISAIVLTHAHEDHLGAVPYLWHRFRVPVYATPFAAAFLKRKLAETDLVNMVPIKKVPLGGKFSAGPFDMEFVSMTHSIPEPNALVIRTPEGTIVHTGDFKFDPEPVICDEADEDRLEELGDEGVLALVCDSTNVFSPGTSHSEGALEESLTKAIGQCRQKVAVTCFASNIARLETIYRAAQANDRDVVLVGRSLRRMDEVARETGYLDDIPPFVTEKEAGYIPEDKILIICTGSQGEPQAALSKIAEGTHPNISLKAGDTVIFSSRTIPGNEKSIGKLQNMLVRREIDVVTDKDAFIHVSGHPARDELAKMYQLIRPQLAVPMHGELRHLNANADLALECNVPESIVIENGEVLRLAPGPVEVVDTVETGRLVWEGKRLVPLDGELLRGRKRALFNGAVVVSLALDEKGKIVSGPKITQQGLLEGDEDQDVLYSIVDDIYEAVERLSRKDKRDDEVVDEEVRLATRRGFRKIFGKKPITSVHLLRV